MSQQAFTDGVDVDSLVNHLCIIYMHLLVTRTGYLLDIKFPCVQDIWHYPKTQCIPSNVSRTKALEYCPLYEYLTRVLTVLLIAGALNDLIAETELTTKSGQYNIKNRLKSQPHI